jgi:uncharacterized protein (TIGR03435 family)
LVNKLLLAIVLANPPIRAQEPSDLKPQFEVASIKKSVEGPSRARWVGVKISGPRVTISRMSAEGLIMFAYQVKPYQIETAGKWPKQEIYDVLAKADGEGEVSQENVRLMLQSLLVDRFQLRFHREPREIAIYTLVTGKNGPKFKEGAPDGDDGLSMTSRNRVTQIDVKRGSMDQLADHLTANGDRPVLDKTGLAGQYDYKLTWTIDRGQPPSETDGPSIFAALQEQLGLKLEPQKRSVMTVVIDRLEKPPAN